MTRDEAFLISGLLLDEGFDHQISVGSAKHAPAPIYRIDLSGFTLRGPDRLQRVINLMADNGYAVCYSNLGGTLCVITAHDANGYQEIGRRIG